jgi:hypothetical protein
LRRLLLTLLAFQIITLRGQVKCVPLSISLGNEATAIPYTNLLTSPVHPIIQVGTEFKYKNSSHHHLYQTANLGYIFHNHLYQGIYLNSEICYDYKFDFGLNAKALFGLGTCILFQPGRNISLKTGNIKVKLIKAMRGLWRL